jgi:hypothetical protein
MSKEKIRNKRRPKRGEYDDIVMQSEIQETDYHSRWNDKDTDFLHLKIKR